jgi:hypothetical protein
MDFLPERVRNSDGSFALQALWLAGGFSKAA